MRILGAQAPVTERSDSGHEKYSVVVSKLFSIIPIYPLYTPVASILFSIFPAGNLENDRCNCRFLHGLLLGGLFGFRAYSWVNTK